MSRRQQTIATFAVTTLIPTGFTSKQIETYIKDALFGWRGNYANSSLSEYKPDPGAFMVILTKKVTQYGS